MTSIPFSAGGLNSPSPPATRHVVFTTPRTQEEGCRRSSNEFFIQIQSPIDVVIRRRWKACLYTRGQQWTRNTLCSRSSCIDSRHRLAPYRYLSCCLARPSISRLDSSSHEILVPPQGTYRIAPSALLSLSSWCHYCCIRADVFESPILGIHHTPPYVQVYSCIDVDLPERIPLY